MNREVKFLRGLFHRAFREGLLRRDITLDLKPLKVMRRKVILPTLEEIREVLEVATPSEVRNILTAFTLTGARSQELFHLSWESVDFNNRLLHIQPREEDREGETPDWDPKNEPSIREVPMADEVFDILVRLRRERPNAGPAEAVFLMPPNEVYPDARPFYAYPNYAYRKLRKAINVANRARRRAGRTEMIPRFNIRLLRHFFISWSLTREENRLTELELIAIVGHVDQSMFKTTYFHADMAGETGRRMRAASLFGSATEHDDEENGEDDDIGIDDDEGADDGDEDAKDDGDG